MLDLLLNAIYRQFIRAALPGLASQGARRWSRSSRHYLLFSASASSWPMLLTHIAHAA